MNVRAIGVLGASSEAPSLGPIFELQRDNSPAVTPLCAADGCPNAQRVSGWCLFHYERLRSHDQLDLPTIEERFWRQVDKSWECWIWTGERQRTETGAGRFRFQGKSMAAHHVAWILINGDLPKGVHLRRTCEVVLCVRPDHLSYRRRAKPKKLDESEYVEPSTLTCSECGAEKACTEFAINGHRRRGRQSYCKACGRARGRRRRGVHPDDAAFQCPLGQRCEICSSDGGKRGLFLDHDHQTGRFRGWLCHACNAAIGHLSDDPSLLERGIAYLTRSIAAAIEGIAAGSVPRWVPDPAVPLSASADSSGPGRPDGKPLLRPLAERPGETSPARPGRVGPAVPFDLAAVMCGYEPTSPTGAAAARHDHRVWDLVGR